MTFKTVTTVVTDLEADRGTLEFAAALATANDAHLDVICLGVDPTQPGFYYAGAAAVAVQAGLELAGENAGEIEREVEKHLEGRPLKWSAEAMTCQSVGLAQFIGHHARFSDVAILPKPYSEGRGHEAEVILEAVLFNAEIPVFVVPDEFDGAVDFANILIAWNESREAMRAVRQSLPVLSGARSVNITLVDPPAHAPDRSDPGGALSQMLARHDIHADVAILAKTMPRVSDVIARQAEDINADLIVMGAYGHSRFRESILGGATRNILENANLPVFMAH